MMKSILAAAVLGSALSFGTIASAQDLTLRQIEDYAHMEDT